VRRRRAGQRHGHRGARLSTDPPEVDDDPGALALALDPAFVFPRRVEAWATAEPDRPFLAEVTGRALSYGEAWEAVRRRVTWLRRLGVGPGDRVVTTLPASVDAVLVWLALGVLGALEVAVNPELRGEHLDHVLASARARVALVRPEHVGVVSGPELRVAVVESTRDDAAGCAPADLFTLPGPADPAGVIFTSGTTGLPRGAVLSWAQFAATIGRIPRSWLSGDDAVYCCHPMFHVTGRTPLLSASDHGGRVVLRERFSAGAFLDDVRAHRATTTTAHIPLLLATAERPDDADNPLRVVFGAHDPVQVARFSARFAVRVVGAYGSTEVGFPLVSRVAPDDASRRWCGRLRRGYEAKIVDPEVAGPHAIDDPEVPDGHAGELWIRPPARELMMLGYLDDPDATAEVIVDGWYRTGDALARHRDGEFSFVDRLRDTIRRHGENISSSAVEAAAVAEPDVAEAAVLGVPDPVAGHEVLLVVVASRPQEFEAGDLWGRLATRLPRHTLPAWIAVTSALPRTPTNKVRKAGLLDRLDLASAWTAPH
jgi:crotonobetaine/carnitine-CoA ligase